MSADEKNEGAGGEAGAEAAGGQGPKGTARPSGGDAFRIGTKEEIRAAGGGEGGSKLKPRDAMRDGTK